MAVVLICALFYILGYLVCRVIQKSMTWAAINGLLVGFLLAAVALYPMHYQWSGSTALWVVVGAVGVGGVGAWEYFCATVQAPSLFKMRWSKKDIWTNNTVVNGGIVACSLLWMNFRFVRIWVQDTPFHGYVIQQLLQKKWPVHAAFPCDAEMCYHFGFNGVVAAVAGATSMPYPYVTIGLTVMILGVVLYNIVDWATQMGWTPRFRWVALFGVLFMTGFSDVYLDDSQTLTSMHALMLTPSGLLSIAVWVMCVNLLERIDLRDSTNGWRCVAFVVLMALGSPIYAVNIFPGLLLVLAYVASTYLLKKEYRKALWPVWGVALIAAVCTLFPYGTLSASDEFYESAFPIPVWMYFTQGEYLDYVQSIILSFLGPVIFTVGYYALLLGQPKRYLRLSQSMQLMTWSLWVVILPFVITFTSINPIDNFFKLPNIALCSTAMIAAAYVYAYRRRTWVLRLFVAVVVLATIREFQIYPFWVDVCSVKLSQLCGIDKGVASVVEAMAILVGVYSVYGLYKRVGVYHVMAAMACVSVAVAWVYRDTYRSVAHKNIDPYIRQESDVPELLKFCGECLEDSDVVFAPQYYNIDFCRFYRHNAPLNYALVIGTMPFEGVSAVSGRLLLNHANFAGKKKEEYVYPIWKRIEEWYTEKNYERVDELGADYLVYTIEGLPDYVDELVALNKIAEVSRCDKEGWVMYRIDKGG